jgi:hypothetical protein
MDIGGPWKLPRQAKVRSQTMDRSVREECKPVLGMELKIKSGNNLYLHRRLSETTWIDQGK